MTDTDKVGLASAIRIVLVGTSHPGNIGASARAMKTMGLAELVLVAPRGFPSAEATARAAGADDILAGARVCERLDEAVRECGWVLGTSARSRRLQWPELDPGAAAARAVAEVSNAPVALVFGREKSGLKNEELDLCHALVRIPTAGNYTSLNLSAAVQVLSYELRNALDARTGRGDPLPEVAQAVTQAEMEGFYEHLDRVLVEIGYLDPSAPKLLRRRLRRMFNRTRPERSELNILRGILSAIQNRP